MTALAETRPEPPAPAPHDRASPSAHGLVLVAYGHSFRAQGPAPVRCVYWIARISTDWAESVPDTALSEATIWSAIGWRAPPPQCAAVRCSRQGATLRSYGLPVTG